MTETRVCQNCKGNFVIEPADFNFYKKISVPPPTWCPNCRAVRRMSWRNMWHLFKKADAKTGEFVFSAVPPDSPVKIYDKDYWLSDEWDPLSYGREIDWSRPFLTQFFELLHDVPIPAHSVQGLVNCEYCTNISYAKNCYLVRAASYTEDSAYLIWDGYSKQCMDSHMTDHCEFSYGNVNTTKCYKTFFSVNCEDCQDVWLSKDCNGCSSCVGCVGLRNKSYHIFNQPYSKEEYVKKIAELRLGSRTAFNECQKKAHALWLSFPVKYMQGIQNVDVSGDYIYESKNTHESFRVKGAEDCKYCLNLLVGPNKDCYDYSNWGLGSELLYESLVCGDQTYNLKFCWNCFGGSKNIQYSIFCPGAQDIFGCISAHKKQYCILNKQYSKEEYLALVPKLIAHMNAMPYVDKKGRVYAYGEFFPSEMSPFPYNVSEAQELYPKTKEQVLAEGLWWRDEDKKEYAATKRAADFGDNIKDVGAEILKETLRCAHGGTCQEECVTAFRIIPRELEFLKQFNLPLPDLCPNCRHYERLQFRNVPRYFDRQCQCSGQMDATRTYRNTAAHTHGAVVCPNKFKTTYAPDRSEMVYCEQCYNAEVA